MRLRLAASGGVSAAVAWERYARLELWPTWSPQLRRVDPPRAALAGGLTGQVYGPLGVRADFVVDHVGDREWKWTVRRGPLRVRLEHGVEGTACGSRTWLVLRGPAVVVLGYAPVAKWALHRLVTLPPA
jgi:hypothetical protein